ncbi:MAG: nicotinamide-nucleotide amidase [Vibrio sp.]
MESPDILNQVVGKQLQQAQQILVTAESCTGGGVAALITDVAGSSQWFDRAFVTYSNDAKQTMIGVQKTTLDAHGAVSEPVVREMAAGALAASNGTIAVAISGIAGPGGGTAEKPVGTVCFAWQDTSGWEFVSTQHFTGDRREVRTQAVYFALQTISDYLGKSKQ